MSWELNFDAKKKKSTACHVAHAVGCLFICQQLLMGVQIIQDQIRPHKLIVVILLASHCSEICWFFSSSLDDVLRSMPESYLPTPHLYPKVTTVRFLYLGPHNEPQRSAQRSHTMTCCDTSCKKKRPLHKAVDCPHLLQYLTFYLHSPQCSSYLQTTNSSSPRNHSEIW